MGKLIKDAELNKVINEEIIKIYEMENTEIQIILNNYWCNKGEERPNFSNIKDEIFYFVNKLTEVESKDKDKANTHKRKGFLSRLRGKNYE